MIKLAQPDIEYHADPAIGSTTAKLWLDSPQLFKDEIDGLRPKKDTRALQYGRAAHLYFTDRAQFDRTVLSEPINPKTGKPYGVATLAYQEWILANPGSIVLGDQDRADLARMDARMPDAVRAILGDPGKVVESSYYQTLDKLPVKCRPDLILDGVIYDLKTIGNIDDIERHISRYRYWFSAGWYRMIVKVETQKLMPFRFIFSEKLLPHRWRIVDLDADWMMCADDMADRVLGEISAGDFRDRDEVHMVVSRPTYELDENEGEE